MNLLLYDKTFEGFLSLIFYSYEYKVVPDKIADENMYQDEIFVSKYNITTCSEKAERVWKGILKKTSKNTCQEIYKVFLSEQEGIEMLLFNYMRLIIDSSSGIVDDYSNDIVLQVKNLHKKVIREAQRILMFIRFQRTDDDIYYASFEPLYNVLPLTINHFKNRFSDQKWIIYDVKRNYGFFYNLKGVDEVRFEMHRPGKVNKEILSNEELFFSDLWRSYYDSTNTKERKNLKLHKQFMPKRFWKYLPEKDILAS